jgi:hypothetical protein
MYYDKRSSLKIESFLNMIEKMAAFERLFWQPFLLFTVKSYFYINYCFITFFDRMPVSDMTINLYKPAGSLLISMVASVAVDASVF